MLLKDDVAIRAPRKQVSEFLIDPNQVEACAPAVETVEFIENLKGHRRVVSAGFGGIKARRDMLRKEHL